MGAVEFGRTLASCWEFWLLNFVNPHRGGAVRRVICVQVSAEWRRQLIGLRKVVAAGGRASALAREASLT